MFYYFWTSILSTFTSILVLSNPRFWNLQNMLCWGNERHLCSGRQELIHERLIFAKPVQYPSNRILRGKKNENSIQSQLISIASQLQLPLSPFRCSPSNFCLVIQWDLMFELPPLKYNAPIATLNLLSEMDRGYRGHTWTTKTWGGCSKLMSL